MGIKNIFIVFLFFLPFFLESHSATAQCEIKFEHWVESEEGNAGESAIYISLNGDPAPYTFKLYDLFQGKVINEKVKNDLNKGEKVLLFAHVPASTYTIYVTREGCDNYITLGGKYGLIVKGK